MYFASNLTWHQELLRVLHKSVRQQRITDVSFASVKVNWGILATIHRNSGD